MTYRFDPEILSGITKQVTDLLLENGAMLSALIEKLSLKYPEYIENQQRRWLCTHAGGVLGKISFVYLSFTEYLLILGCPTGTSGFSGRYNFMDIYEFVLAGQVADCDLETDQIAPYIYRPGEYSHLKPGRANSVSIQAGTWTLEYGRGPNITAFFFGVISLLLSSVELKTLGLTISEYMQFVIKDFKRKSQ